MINIHDGQITDLLSNTLRYNPETISIGYAILQEKRRILYLAERTLLMAAVEILDEKTLDYLAVELRTPAYSDSYPLETKRTLIKGTLPYYERLGTPAAVNWAVKAIFGNGAIREWFDYDGDPHHFQVDIPITGMISPELMEELRRTIATVKRLTSWLDSITTYFEMEGKVYITPFLWRSMPVTTLPEIEPVFPGSLSFRTSAAFQTVTETKLPRLEDFSTTITAVCKGKATAALQNISETRLPELEE